jgi:cytochrome c553
MSMMKRLTLLAATATFSFTTLATLATLPAAAAEHAVSAAKTDPTKGKAIVEAVCGACHGADGNSSIAANPKLAGQHAEYLVKQMREFKAAEGATPKRVNAVMNGMIAAYDETQMRDIAAYFASQTQKPETAKNRETIEAGQRIYRAGNNSKGLSACAGCHGPTGAGIPAQFPRIGGQFSEYIEAQLKTFRAGAEATAPSDSERANDPNKMMRMVAIKMTDAEIKAVADYIAGLR